MLFLTRARFFCLSICLSFIFLASGEPAQAHTIIARGGDHYDAFLKGKTIRQFEPLGELTIDYYRKHGTVPVPASGRQKDITHAEQAGRIGKTGPGS